MSATAFPPTIPLPQQPNMRSATVKERLATIPMPATTASHHATPLSAADNVPTDNPPTDNPPTDNPPQKSVVPPPCWKEGKWDMLEMYAYIDSLPAGEKEKVVEFLKGGEKIAYEDPDATPINKLPHQSIEELEEYYGINL